MLERLHIRNLALIEDMTLEFADGINVISGETGAGKSFILKALGFLLGDKLTSDSVRPGAERAQIDAIFMLDDQELILRRELIAATGRSRFYINDVASSQDAIREFRQRLLSYTSQHSQQHLLQPAFQAALLEKDVQAPQLLARRTELLAHLRDLANEISDLKEKQAGLAERRELLEMQKAEIDKVAPKPGEEERLEHLRASIRNNVSARQNYRQALELLHGDEGPGLIQMLQDFERLIARIGGEEADADAAAIASFRQQLAHIGSMIKKPQAVPEKTDMNAVEERLFQFAQLKRKLKRTLPEILALKDEIQENLSFLDVCALDLGRLQKAETKASNELKEIIAELRPLREAAGVKLARDLENELRQLGFSEHIKVIPEYQKVEIWPGVSEERGHISWAPNPGQRAQPLDKIASGGELSRFMLALSALADQKEDTTFIFDEVDAGVGGLTLNKLADKLEALSFQNQIILITHWPQLAVRARKHFMIHKEVNGGSTFTQCEALDADSRREELARMAGGGKEGHEMAANLLSAHKSVQTSDN